MNTDLIPESTNSVVGQWISVKDKLPIEGQDIILFDGNEVFCGNWYYGKNNKVCWGVQACDGICYGNYEKKPITHWMPLPKPPGTS